MDCSKCQSEAVTFIRYSGNHLCRRHFNEFLEKRVRKEIRKQIDIKEGGSIAVAVSGGKDSLLVLHQLHDIFEKRGDVELHVITVDEGISGYRDESIPYVKDACAELDVPLTIGSFERRFGCTMDDIAAGSSDLTPCSYCGVLRRQCLNLTAKEVGAKYLATGLNLDDTIQSIIMNIFRGDIERLARLGPHKVVQKGLVPRIQPLRLIPEKEAYLYAVLNDVRFHDGECPYAAQALRNKYRRIVYDLERDSPGTRHAILQSYDDLAPLLTEKYPRIDLSECKKCGEPGIAAVCKACTMLEDVKKV